MPTDIHELSPAAAIHATPNGRPKTLTEGANLLQGYFADNGFNNITSEWWHFSDAIGQRSADSVGILGEFVVSIIQIQLIGGRYVSKDDLRHCPCPVCAGRGRVAVSAE